MLLLLAQSSGVPSLGSAGSSLWPLEALLESVLLLEVCPSPCRGRGSQPLRHEGRYLTGKPQEPMLTLGGWSGESSSSHWPGLLFPEAAENLEGPGRCHSSSGRGRRRVRGSRSFGASRWEAIGFLLLQSPIPWLEGWPLPALFSSTTTLGEASITQCPAAGDSNSSLPFSGAVRPHAGKGSPLCAQGGMAGLPLPNAWQLQHRGRFQNLSPGTPPTPPVPTIHAHRA